MEKRTDSPYPKIDRPILAVIGILLVISCALFAWSDRKHDWRYYQAEFKAQVTEKLGAKRRNSSARASSRSGSPTSSAPIAA